MTLTRCPHCGHTVLSVASQCPACSGAVTQTFLGLEHEGELAECRSCGHRVRSRTSVCPHCGVPHPAGRSRRVQAALPVLAAVLLGALAIMLRNEAFHRPPAGTATAADTPPASKPAPAPTPPPPAQVVGSAVPAQVATADSAPPLSPPFQARWTADWSNMRRSPHNESPIVRVLAPGTEVHAAPDKWGWWAVLWKGDTVGYIAGALLRPTRPGR